MKRNNLAVLLSVGMLLSSCVLSHAGQSKLMGFKEDVQGELVQIKALMTKKDPVLVSSMYDSCLIAMNQIDAYISMITIFNTIDEKAVKEEAVNPLIIWLGSMKKMNTINSNTLRDTSKARSPETKARMEKVKALFEKLNKEIDIETAKWEVIRKSLPLR